MEKKRNLWVLPTDNKPSRLYFNVNDKEFQICEIEKPSTILKPNRHIYITSDEEIKEGDWVYNIVQKTVFKADKSFLKLIGGTLLTNQKIILTTDKDLIKDGVQAIDDEFLEWFVQNPSCEEVEVIKTFEDYTIVGGKSDEIYYKIIIPKEEQKQETLEEVAEKYSKYHYANREPYLKELYASKLGFIDGAKWQQERMYSAEEVLKHLNHFNMMPSSQLDKYTDDDEMVTMKWFEQFKKK